MKLLFDANIGERCGLRTITHCFFGALGFGIRAAGWHLKKRAGDAVVVEQPIELPHGPFPTVEAYERKGKTEDMPEQDIGAPPHLATIGLTDIDDLAAEHGGGSKQGSELRGRRPEHGVD